MFKFILHSTLALSLLLQLGQTTMAQENPYIEALPLWQTTLDKFVDEQGATDFIALSEDHSELSQFLEVIAKVSPASHPDLFPQREDILAYYINSYNALAMWGIIERELPEHFNSLFRRASFFKFRKVTIGGKRTDLYAYENKVIRPYGEARLHFALNCMVVDCPRLPQKVFTAGRLETDLQEASVEFFNKDKHIKIDHDAKILWLSGIMKFYTKDYVASGKKQDLVAYVNQFREDKIPESYTVKFLAYDWTVNQSSS